MRNKGDEEKAEKGVQQSLFCDANRDKMSYTPLIVALAFITLFFVGIGLGGKISQNLFCVKDDITQISAADASKESQMGSDESESDIEESIVGNNQALETITEEDNENTVAEYVETIPNEGEDGQEKPENDNFVSDETAAEDIVYRTRAGNKYHKETCRYVQENGIKLTREEAEQMGLEPCSVCNP